MALIGIDLGTTFSAMATFEHGAVVEIDNKEGDKTTPSVVFLPTDDLDKAIVGQSAVLQAGTAPDRTVRFAKRQMGTDFKMTFGTKEYTPVDISAAILKKLKADAEAFLGDEPVEAAVITVPAHFDIGEREATKQAALQAGLKVLAILAEPVAAAIDFAQNKKDVLANKNVLVYDLGGGTFDVTLMRVSQPDGPGGALSVDVLGKAGARELGGADFDRALALYVASEFNAAHGKNPEDDANGFDVLMQRCQLAKKDLSTSDSSTIQCHHDGITHSVSVTRAKFEELIGPLLNETADKAAELVVAMAEQTKNDARPISWANIDYILMTGGSTRIPIVATLIEKIAGKKPITNRNPDMNVARGAAYAAFDPSLWTILSSAPGATAPTTSPNAPPPKPEEVYTPTAKEMTGITLSAGKIGGVKVAAADVANDSIGVVAYAAGTTEMINDILLKKGSQLPVSMDEPQAYQTAVDGQTDVRIPITKGESRKPDEVQELGAILLSGIPPGPAGQPILVKLSYSQDGLITAEALHKPTGKSMRVEVKVNPKKMEF